MNVNPIPCAIHSTYGWCAVQHDGSHVTLDQCCCEGIGLDNPNCPIDLHRNFAEQAAAHQARVKRLRLVSVFALSDSALERLHNQRCVCGHRRFEHDRLRGSCLHDRAPYDLRVRFDESCNCEHFEPDLPMLIPLEDQLAVDLIW